MTDHKAYKYLAREDLTTLEIDKAKLIIDNTEIFKDYNLGENTIYHIAGDGKLGDLEQ